MPELMIFREVLEGNAVPFVAHIESEGEYVDGEWVDGVVSPTPMSGVILPLSNDDLKYDENGTYTVKEKKLLTVHQITEGTQIDYKGNFYTAQAFKDLSEYTDVNIYLLRWRQR